MAKTYDMDGSVTNSISERQQKKKKPTVVDKLKTKLKNRVLGKLLRVPDQERLKKLKESSQPLRVKTGGSTFKNPVKSTERKVWELIRESVPEDISFGDAKISSKHSNFFVNSKNASFSEMNKLINFVRDEVKKKTGISLDLEIEIIE